MPASASPSRTLLTTDLTSVSRLFGVTLTPALASACDAYLPGGRRAPRRDEGDAGPSQVGKARDLSRIVRGDHDLQLVVHEHPGGHPGCETFRRQLVHVRGVGRRKQVRLSSLLDLGHKGWRAGEVEFDIGAGVGFLERGPERFEGIGEGGRREDRDRPRGSRWLVAPLGAAAEGDDGDGKPRQQGFHLRGSSIPTFVALTVAIATTPGFSS